MITMKILLFIAIVLILAGTFVLVNSGNSFPLVLLFCLVPIIVVGHLYGLVWAYLVSAVFSAFCIGLTKLGLKALPMWVCVVNFNLLPLLVFRFNGLFKRCQQDCKKRIDEAEEQYQQLLKEDKQIKATNARFERDVLEMARLYEITKAMSASLEFSGIFNVLKNILSKTLKFGSGRLILTIQKSAAEKPAVGKVYRIQPGGNVGAYDEERLTRLGTAAAPFVEIDKHPADKDENDIVEPSAFDRMLAERYPTQERKPLVVSGGQRSILDSPLELAEGVNSFVAAGLFSEGALVGILAIENIAEEQMDRLLIIASQFELELQKVRLYEMVQQLAIMDGLTGMFVRRYLLERCQHELRRSIKHKLNLACLVVDIDFFKDCNDKYGHLVGDVVLKRLADIIKENIREVDFAGRYGGEEFCVILPDTPKSGAVHVAERLRKAVESHVFKAYDENIKTTISIGVAVFPDDASDLNQLIDYADQAMYKAKAEGRNRVSTCMP
jgi:diguanylate cyclase (GGDEF)-like protein